MPATAKRRFEWKEILAVSASIVTIGASIYFIQRNEKADLPEEEQFGKAETKNSNISSGQAAVRANQLFTIMDGPNWDNSQEFIRPFVNVNKDGIRLIFNKFGLREGTYTTTKENLYQWISGEADKTILVARAIWNRVGLIPPF